MTEAGEESSAGPYSLQNIDPELVQFAAMQPVVDYAEPDRVRAVLRRGNRLAKALRKADEEQDQLTVTDRWVSIAGRTPEVRVRTYESPSRRRPAPAMIFFHGGAFVTGDLETEDARCREFASRTGVVVISVDYRLAPEHPFPAGFDDCYHVLVWAAAGGEELALDPSLITVGGSSAGGALAAAVSLAARDRGGPSIALQLMVYPVTDDRMTSHSMREFRTVPGWNTSNTVHMWRHYLGDTGTVEPSQYAAPARARDLAGLPPAYIMVAERDPLRDEGIAFARALMAAGVPTELHQFAGGFHGFDAAAPHSPLGRRALDEQCAVLARASGVEFRL